MATDDIELLKEYDAWKAQRKIDKGDLSPEAFYLDRARDQALQKLINISDLIDGLPAECVFEDLVEFLRNVKKEIDA